MDKRGKVMNGLECCAHMTGEMCGKCPYVKECEYGMAGSAHLAADALELLKAQEPRVMTLEEVLAHYSLPPVVLDDLDWQENYLQDIEPLYFDFPVEDSWIVHWRGYQQVRKYLEDWRASYGQKWRCWTSRPTDEQREAVKWDG